jgi:RNA polymerase sigma-70 factor (ECF subfamily)
MLVRRHYRAAYVIALAILGNRMDAEDVCQDAFLKALRALDSCRDPSRFAPWLGQIVRNTARNASESRRIRSGPDLDTVDLPAAADPSRDSERSDLAGRLLAAIGHLSELQRQVVLLHDLEGWDHRSIASAVGVSEGMSRQHLFHARRALRARLGPDLLREFTDD